MASNIVELFGYSPRDNSSEARKVRETLECPFLKQRCVKMLKESIPSGVCTLKPKQSGPVICCPQRLYSGDYAILRDVAEQAFGLGMELVVAGDLAAYRKNNSDRSAVAVFGKRWGKELRLPNRSKRGEKAAGAYFVDWILAHIDGQGRLLGFVAVEVQSIDTTGNYQAERSAYMEGTQSSESSSAGFNWENVNKRILPQLIYKGHVLRREPLCQKGLFFICPSPVYRKIAERLGDKLEEIHQQPGALTMMWYDLAPEVPPGHIRELRLDGQFTTTIDQLALAFTAPSNLPPSRVYEQAIRAEL